MRIEHMERQLANLTGVVQKALTHSPLVGPVAVNPNFLAIPGQMRNGKSRLYVFINILSIKPSLPIYQ